MTEPHIHELVRVRDDAGTEWSASYGYALATGLTVLDKPARDRFGRPIPAKHKTTPRTVPDPAPDPTPDPTPATTDKE